MTEQQSGRAIGEPPVTERIARFVKETRFDDLPAALVEIGKAHVLDALGVALAGAIEPGSRIIQAFLENTGCLVGGARLLGTCLSASPRFAAFANGAAIHAHDYDDTNAMHRPDRNGGLHATGLTLSGALAIAEPGRRSGRDVMEAFHIGAEVGCKINYAIDERHYSGGYHATGTLGGFAVAAAVSRLLGSSVPTTRMALGLAASQAAGLRENFGTMTKPFHAGRAAESGIIAAELAACGFTAAPNALEAPRGLFSAAAGGFDPDPIMDGLGKPWAYEDPGTWIKPHPCGALTHPAMTSLLRMIRSHVLTPERVKSVRIRTNKKIKNTLLHDRPSDALQAKFSMPFCAAVLFVKRTAGLAEFTDELVNAPEISAMLEKIDYRSYDEVGSDFTNTTTFVEIDLVDGKTLSDRIDYPKGSPQDAMSYEEVAEKFKECADFAKWPAQKRDATIEMVRQFETVDDIRKLTTLVSA